MSSDVTPFDKEKASSGQGLPPSVRRKIRGLRMELVRLRNERLEEHTQGAIFDSYQDLISDWKESRISSEEAKVKDELWSIYEEWGIAKRA